MNRLYIIGAGGHGKVIADIAWKSGYTDIAFLDDNAVGDCTGYPIRGTVNEAEALSDGNADFVIAIGNNKIRRMIAQMHPNLHYVTLIHPRAVVGSFTQVGIGTVVMAGAIINACAKIGKHCIINSGAIVEHDNILEDYVHISPNAALGGTVYVGEATHIGIGATVRNNISICKECLIGAGATVVKNIEESGTYAGVPASVLK